MKESTKTILLFLGLILSLIFAPSCTKQETIHQSVCDGSCDATHIVVYKNQEIYFQHLNHTDQDLNLQFPYCVTCLNYFHFSLKHHDQRQDHLQIFLRSLNDRI